MLERARVAARCCASVSSASFASSWRGGGWTTSRAVGRGRCWAGWRITRGCTRARGWRRCSGRTCWSNSARASLRTTLATLRRELGEAAGCVVAERERVGLQEGAELWVDVAEIDRLIAAGRHPDALALCGDELLVDLDDDWVLEARQAHRERVGELLVALGESAEAAGDADAAVSHARRRLELDPVSEDAARVLMRRLAESGDRAAAVAAYEAFRGVLQRELGMAPSGETRALAERLRTERRGAAGGRPEPAAAARARPPRAARRSSAGASRSPRCERAWRRARAGSARVVTVHGEAGSGKTRLLIELADEAARRRTPRCSPVAASRTARSRSRRSPRRCGLIVAAPGGALPEWVAGELARLLPELEPDAAPPEGEPQDARHRLFEAVAATIGQAAREAPVLLIVEDLHWADRATLGMLAHVIRTLAWAPLLVAGSLRDEGAGGDPALRALLGDLRRERRLERVALAGLSEEETGALAGAWLGAPASPGLAAARPPAHRRQPALRRGARAPPGRVPRRSLGRGAVARRREVPEGVRSVIDRRLARLPERAGASGTRRGRGRRGLRARGRRRSPARRARRGASPRASRRRSTAGWSTRRRRPGAIASRTRSSARRCWRV